VPWVVWGFFKIITPFIDPVTAEKLKFNEDMKQYVPPEQLSSLDWGGDMDFDYDHGVYWPALNDLCRQKRQDKSRRWEAGGKEIGESEEYLSGGIDVSVKGIKFEPSSDGEKKSPEDDAVDAVQEKLAEARLDSQEQPKPVETAVAQ
jgi:hypothetical protein